MKTIILFSSVLLAAPALSAPAAHPLPTQLPALPIPPKEKRQDSTITYTRDPLTGSGIPSITDSLFPSPTDSIPIDSTSVDSSIPNSTDNPSTTETPTSTGPIPYSSTPPDSISLIPTSSWGGGTTIQNSGTLTFPGGATQTFTFGSQTITLTFPGSPSMSLAAEPNPDQEENQKRQLLPLTEDGGSWTTDSILPASTFWDNGGPVFTLTLPAEGVRDTGTPEVEVGSNEEGENVVEVIKRQIDTITWDSTLPVTTYWGDQTITIGGETITFVGGTGGPGMSLTIDAVEARVTAGPEYTNE